MLCTQVWRYCALESGVAVYLSVEGAIYEWWGAVYLSKSLESVIGLM